MTEVQQNAIGLTIILSVSQEDGEPVDLTGATTKDLLMKAPSGALATKTLTLSATPGIATYATVDGDFAEAGKYQLQGKFVLPDGFNGRTEVIVVHVLANLS